MRLRAKLVKNRLLERSFFFGTPSTTARFNAIALHGGQHTGSLLAAHHANARIGPHPQKARAKGAATHAVVARSKTAANDDGELGHLGRGHSGNHLGAIARNAFAFVFAAHHEAGDVLQKHQGYFALAAQLNEVRALERRL